MNEARKRAAEDFAREVMRDPTLCEGLGAMIEGLEWACFQRWRQTEAGEGWRKVAGELAAIRELGVVIKTLGRSDGGER